jgi:opacity protein-like surface antigen
MWTTATAATKRGRYVEGSLGYAYRPIDNDRLNALMKFTYLYDNPGADQVTVDGTTSSPAQRSYIFSGDVSYDVIPQLTLGAKYGVRIGDTRERVAGSHWTRSQVHLGVLRADLHLVHELDAMLEGRALWSPTTKQTDYGAIAAVYRHLGDNLKVGVGYNFGRFSDDLRDLSFNDHGVFLNVIGKF